MLLTAIVCAYWVVMTSIVVVVTVGTTELSTSVTVLSNVVVAIALIKFVDVCAGMVELTKVCKKSDFGVRTHSVLVPLVKVMVAEAQD